MKTSFLSFIVVCLCIALNFSVPAQQPTKARRARQKAVQPQKKSEQPVVDKTGEQEQQAPQPQPGQTQPAESNPQEKKEQETTSADQSREVAILDRFNDYRAEDIDVMFFPSMYSAGVKGTVTRPNKHTVSVKFASPGNEMYDKVFTLKYSSVAKQYLLTVKSTSGLSIENFPLSFSEEDGFTGEGRTSDNDWAVKASIKKKGESQYRWDVTFRGGPTEIRAYIFTLEPKGSVK